MNAATQMAGQRACDIGFILTEAEGVDRGGPTVRVPRTVAALRALGLDAALVRGDAPRRLSHVLNIWPFTEAYAELSRLKRRGLPVVFSPLLLLPGRGVRQAVGSATLPGIPDYETVLVRRLLGLADLVIALSSAEAACCEHLAGQPLPLALVPNPVESSAFVAGDPALFLRYAAARFTTDLNRGFVLAVGRIEPRKNQLRLISALADGPPLVLIGHEADADYAAACRAAAGAKVIFAGRLPPESELLASSYAACQIFAHVATAEGAPLVALEAGAAGAPMMLSDHAAHREFLGPFARLVPALDTDAMRATLHDLWDRPPPAGQRRLQAIHFSTAHGYLEHAATLARLYSALMR